MTSFRLECGACEHSSDPTPLATLCPECGSPQLVRYSLIEEGTSKDLRTLWAERTDRMWRYRELLPLLPGEAPVSLGEGATPLVRLQNAGESLDLNLLLKTRVETLLEVSRTGACQPRSRELFTMGPRVSFSLARVMQEFPWLPMQLGRGSMLRSSSPRTRRRPCLNDAGFMEPMSSL